MKKNILWSLLALIVSLTATMIFVSCGDEEDDETPNSPIVGTWVRSESDSHENWAMNITETLVFKNDLSYARSNEGVDGPADTPHRFGSRELGTYTYSGNSLLLTATSYEYLNPDNGKWESQQVNETYTSEYTATISGKQLTLTLKGNEDFPYVFTKK